MKAEEIEAKIVEGIRTGTAYGVIATQLGIKKGKMWYHTTRLLKRKVIMKSSVGRYYVNDGSAPILPLPKRGRPTTNVVKLRKVETPAPVIVPVVQPVDIETLATELLGKISDLAPSLELHKYKEIEKATMKLIDRIVEVKPLIMTKEEMEEFKEMKALKERAQKIAEIKLYNSNK